MLLVQITLRLSRHELRAFSNWEALWISPRPSLRSQRYVIAGRGITINLLTLGQETAQLEAKAFELEQTTALAAEAKSVLDSWVRYEGQVKIRQQKELSESIIAKIQKELENPKVLQQILQQSVTDVERKHLRDDIAGNSANSMNRNRSIQGAIDEGLDRRANRFPLSPVLFINLLCHSRTSIFSHSFSQSM